MIPQLKEYMSLVVLSIYAHFKYLPPMASEDVTLAVCAPLWYSCEWLLCTAATAAVLGLGVGLGTGLGDPFIFFSTFLAAPETASPTSEAVSLTQSLKLVKCRNPCSGDSGDCWADSYTGLTDSVLATAAVATAVSLVDVSSEAELAASVIFWA